jgi:KUP system potassium uptake protein
MTLTGIMVAAIFFLRRQYLTSVVAFGVTVVDVVFLYSALYKIPNGAYWSLIIAAIPFSIIMIYLSGQKKLFNALLPMDLELFLKKFSELYPTLPKIHGTALFFARDVRKLPPYIPLTMFTNNIIYEDNIIISIRILDNPFGFSGGFEEDLAPGLRVFQIQMGYMEVVDIVTLLRDAGIYEKTIFYGLEDIVTNNIIWRIFSTIKRLTPSFVQFYKLPADKIHGVVTRVEM